MITQVHSITVIVDDQDAALDFYVGKLGWEKRQDNANGPMRWLTVAPVGAETAISLGDPDSFGAKSPSTGGPEAIGITVVTDDIAAEYERLSGQGVEFTDPPEEMPWGDVATWFLDPFGNKYFLVELG